MEPIILQSTPVEFNPALLAFFAVILIGVCVQNWVLARRAENKPLLPSWLQRGRSDDDRSSSPPPP